MFTSAPPSIKSRTISACPLQLARHKAVLPSYIMIVVKRNKKVSGDGRGKSTQTGAVGIITDNVLPTTCFHATKVTTPLSTSRMFDFCSLYMHITFSFKNLLE